MDAIATRAVSLSSHTTRGASTSHSKVHLPGGHIETNRIGVNIIPELELQLNSNSGIGIGIEIGGIENGIGIENSGIGIGIENRNWNFCNC